ncbi:IclR family transcriptional regulator [Corynebacterium pacaense]|uniref:IclR family transcriptional regulator n=1 Tax=Corynebacterium pacaense TaxID=1816684 RepID=UPI0009B959EE|nr:IclR family transcriptional regulator C-terminal domain-containing protein [Corynebacterium pacaense]
MIVIQLIKKAAALIDELARGPATPAELSKALDEPRSSIYRITSSLEDAGLVRQVGDGRFDLGPAILRLGDCAVSVLIDRHELRSQLGWIRDQLGLSAYFAVLSGERITCLDLVEGTDVDLLHLVPGTSLPNDAGAMSRVLWSHASPAAGRPTSRLAVSTAGIEVAADPSPGWSMDDGELNEGVASVAVPVITAGGELVGAVSVAGLRDRVIPYEETIRRILAVAAGNIAHLRTSVPPSVEPGDTAGPATDRGERNPSVIAKAAHLMAILERRYTATPSELAELLGEPLSSVYRLLATLVDAQWIEQIEPRGGYRVGLRMLTLAEDLLRRTDIRQLAAPVLRDLHRRTGETTFLCIRNGTRAVCIERLDGIRVNSRVLQLGSSLPLHIGAAPRALLAFDATGLREDYVASLMEGVEVWRGESSRAEILEELKRERDQGFILSDNNVTPGIAAVGVPIYNHRSEVIASLSLSGLREVILDEGREGDSIVSLVYSGARGISAKLGAPVADLYDAVVVV